VAEPVTVPAEPQPVEEPNPRDELKGQWPRLLLLVGALVLLGRGAQVSTILMIVGLIVMIFLHELGHYLTAKAAGMKVTEFFLGFGPKLWSFRRGETEYGIKLIPAGAYVRIIGMSNLDEVEPEDESRTYRAKPFWRRLSVAVAGSTMHFLLALVLAYGLFVGHGVSDPDSSRWSVAQVVGESAAAKAGLRIGDRIVAIDGESVASFPSASKALQSRPNEAVTLTVERDGATLDLPATLGTTKRGGREVGFLGIGPKIPVVKSGPVEGVGDAAREFGSAVKQSIVGLGHLFSPSGVSSYVDNLTGRNDGGAASVSPPDNGRPTSVVGIVQAGSKAGQDGLVNLLYLFFGVNVFIGIFNLTPLLPFDGGHVVIATYEKIRSVRSGRRYYADVAKLMPVTYAVVLVLGLLFVTSLYMDIVDPVFR
jgi:membrane-associated protease RseP (regulator of RpoE activity)